MRRRRSAGGMVVTGLLASLVFACRADSPSVVEPAPAVVPLQQEVHAVATETEPLPASARSIAARPTREIVQPTVGGRLVAIVTPVGTGPESAVSHITLREFAGTSTAPQREITVAAELANVFDVSWAPDGRWLAFCEGNLVSVVDWTGRPQEIHTGPGGRYPGACTNLEWVDQRQLEFVQLEHADDPALANPRRIRVTLSFEGDTTGVP